MLGHKLASMSVQRPSVRWSLASGSMSTASPPPPRPVLPSCTFLIGDHLLIWHKLPLPIISLVGWFLLLFVLLRSGLHSSQVTHRMCALGFHPACSHSYVSYTIINRSILSLSGKILGSWPTSLSCPASSHRPAFYLHRHTDFCTPGPLGLSFPWHTLLKGHPNRSIFQ